MDFEFDEDKNKQLIKTRGISFEDVIEDIANHGVLLDIPHPNQETYPNQGMFVVDHKGYTCCIPYLDRNKRIRLITIFPNRKYMYLLPGGQSYENEKQN